MVVNDDDTATIILLLLTCNTAYNFLNLSFI